MTTYIDDEKNIYLIRVLGRESYFYNQDRICLGWSGIENIPKNSSDFTKVMKERWPDWPGKYDLWNFKHSINSGDLAVVITGDGFYSIVKLLDYEHRPEWKCDDSSHTRKYEAVNVDGKAAIRIPRYHFVPALRHRLGQGSRGLTCYPLQPGGKALAAYRKFVEDSLKLWVEQRPFSIKEASEDVLAEKLLENLQDQLHHPGQLEDLLVALLLKSGARSAYRNPTRQQKGGDVDVEGIYAIGWEDPENNLIQIGIQAKWRQGEETLSDHEGFVQLTKRLEDPERAIERAYLVTTARKFPTEVIDDAEKYNANLLDHGKQFRIDLIDGIRLAKWILNVGIDSLE